MTNKFDNYPKRVSQDFYQSARDLIVSYYSHNTDIVSIYEYGSVSSPGVSDLDMILVLKNEVNSKEQELEFSNIGNDVNSLVIDGTVMKMPEKVFCKLNYLDNFNLIKLLGKEIIAEEIDEKDESLLEIISIIDWLPERILRLTRAINNEVINISNVLCILHSLSYSIKKINKLTGDTHNSERILNLIQSLRNEWHSMDEPEKIFLSCIRNSISLGYRYIDIFEKYLADKHIFDNSQVDKLGDINLELFSNHFISFTSKHKGPSHEKSGLSASDFDNAFVSVSSFFYPHFYYLSSQKGLLSQVMRSKINPYSQLVTESISDRYKKVLKNKIELAEVNAQFLKINDFKRGLIRYGFHFAY